MGKQSVFNQRFVAVSLHPHKHMSIIAFAVVTVGLPAVSLWLVAAQHHVPRSLLLTSQQLELKNVQLVIIFFINVVVIG